MNAENLLRKSKIKTRKRDSSKYNPHKGAQGVFIFVFCFTVFVPLSLFCGNV